MITLSTLEEIENHKGQLYGLEFNGSSILYLGILEDKVDPGTGLVSRSSDLTVQKFEITKGGKTKFYKKYELTVNDQKVEQIKQSAANKIISEYVAIQLTLQPLSSVILGYQLDDKVFNIGEEKNLLEYISEKHAGNIQSIKDMISQSEFIIKPWKYEVGLVSTIQAPKENGFYQIKGPEKDKVMTFVGNIKEVEKVSQMLLCASQRLLKQGEIKHKPEFLENLISEIPKKIWNPHVYLSTPALFLHQRFMLKGNYQFYHYNDQLFNDNGWGCAYRAFQSLLSWFNLAGHTNVPIPSIQQIQRILFDIDKTRNLTNTKEWIGANEVGWLVNRFVGIDSKIIFLQDGENIMEKVELFKQHFQTMGTPIMYGGGQYAYTILGINYSWKLNECQFLILDPHYILEDKPKSIVDKQGVSWKDKSKLFKKGVYYNFCLPQLPPKQNRNDTIE